MNELSYKVHDKGVLITKGKADEFKIAPRKFLVFSIKSINEALLTNVKVDIYIHNIIKSERDGDSKNTDFNIFNPFIDVSNSKGKGTGLITKAIIKGIDIRMFNENILTIKLNASTADLKAKEGNMVFYNATLEHLPSSKSISSKKIFWDREKMVFKIPGWYNASSPKGKGRGKGLQIDLNFNLIPLYSNKNKEGLLLISQKSL